VGLTHLSDYFFRFFPFENNIKTYTIIFRTPITAVITVNASGVIVMQTQNWDLTADLPDIMSVWQGGGGSLNIQGIKYIT